MAVISSPDCRWNVCKDCGHFFFKDRYIFLYLSVVRGSVDFGNHFLLDFFSNVCSHSHGCTSIAFHLRRAVHHRPTPIAVESQLRRPLLSSPSSRYCPPSITGQCPSPLRCQSPSLIRLVVAFPLVTPTPPVHRFRIFHTACSTFFLMRDTILRHVGKLPV